MLVCLAGLAFAASAALIAGRGAAPPRALETANFLLSGAALATAAGAAWPRCA